MAFPKFQTKEVLNKVLNSGEDALQVDIVSSSEYAEDAEHISGATGSFVLGVRLDTAASLAGADGDYTGLVFDSSGKLYVNSADASVIVDDAGFTPGSSSIQMVGAEFDDSGPDSVDEGDGGAIRMSANRNLYTTIRDGAGAELGAGVLAATSDAVPDLDGLNLLGTHALLSARSDINTTIGLTAVDSTHNALHVAISDGGEIATVTNNRILVDGSGVTQPVSGTVSVSGLLADGHNVTIDNASSDEVYVRGSGTAGSADAAVLTVQGIGSGTALAVTESSPISGFATSSGQLAAGHTIDCNSTFIKLKDGSGTAVTSNSGKLDVCLHSEDGTAINETGNALDVNIASGGFDGVVTISDTSFAVADGNTLGEGILVQGDDGTDRKNIHVDATTGDVQVDVTDIVPGYGATNLGKREDDGHSNLDVGVMALAVRNDDIAAIAATDGDYAPLQVNAAGSLYTKDETGEAGSILVKGTNAVAAGISGTVFIAIQFLEDTVFHDDDGLVASSTQLYPDDAGVGSDISSNGGNTDDVVFPQGMTIFGRWSGFKLASGTVIGYIGYV